jgi:hypothetical protein
MSATSSGARSKMVTADGGRSVTERTRMPVSMRPPRFVSVDAIASVMVRDPPSATAHP